MSGRPQESLRRRAIVPQQFDPFGLRGPRPRASRPTLRQQMLRQRFRREQRDKQEGFEFLGELFGGQIPLENIPSPTPPGLARPRLPNVFEEHGQLRPKTGFRPVFTPPPLSLFDRLMELFGIQQPVPKRSLREIFTTGEFVI